MTDTPVKQNDRVLTVAITGNPNAGKTTIFNLLTGSNQKVGNYGGVTVETKEGTLRHNQYKIRIVDLPGIYSLSAYSIEEIVARNFIINERPDVVLNVMDASNLERNLYLAVQFKELGVPMVVALNMADEMKRKGVEVSRSVLSQEFSAPVVSTIGYKGKGIDRLKEKIIEVATGRYESQDAHYVRYGKEVDAAIDQIADSMSQLMADHDQDRSCDKTDSLCKKTSPRWMALKLLENDQEVIDTFSSCHRQAVDEQVQSARKRIESVFGEDVETIVAEQRYGYVRGIAKAAIHLTAESRMNLSDKIDRVLTNRLLGLPVFAVMMYLTFWLVFTLGETPMGWIESSITYLSTHIADIWPEGHYQPLKSLIVDGIINGVGGVLVFVPNIILLFTAITLLEDTGYMARAAFLMDRMMKWVGLHGKSFIPMLTGFGCTVPGIMGTRILENRRDRMTTMLILPLMSCGARLPIYMLIIPAFFPESQRATMMYTMYIIGVLLAVVAAKILRITVFKGESSPFVMELPPYRIPTLNAIAIHVWQRAWQYIRKAGTVILAISIVMWALTAYPKTDPALLAGKSPEVAKEIQLSNSYTGKIGQTIAPIIKPMGFDWKIGTALVGAFAAKEVFVSQLGIVYAVGEADEESDSLRTQLQENYNPLTGFCIMLFCLIATPCMATVAVMKRESGRWAWAMFQFWGLTLIAFILTTIVYQTGTFLKLGVG